MSKNINYPQSYTKPPSKPPSKLSKNPPQKKLHELIKIQKTLSNKEHNFCTIKIQKTLPNNYTKNSP
jgi:hypothetical protein